MSKFRFDPMIPLREFAKTAQESAADRLRFNALVDNNSSTPTAQRWLILGSDLYLSLQTRCNQESSDLAKLRFQHGLVITADDICGCKAAVGKLRNSALSNLTVIYNLADEESRNLAAATLDELGSRCKQLGIPMRHITFIDLAARRNEVLVQLATPEAHTISDYCLQEQKYAPTAFPEHLNIEDLGDGWAAAYAAAFSSWIRTTFAVASDLQVSALPTLPNSEQLARMLDEQKHTKSPHIVRDPALPKHQQLMELRSSKELKNYMQQANVKTLAGCRIVLRSGKWVVYVRNDPQREMFPDLTAGAHDEWAAAFKGKCNHAGKRRTRFGFKTRRWVSSGLMANQQHK